MPGRRSGPRGFILAIVVCVDYQLIELSPLSLYPAFLDDSLIASRGDGKNG